MCNSGLCSSDRSLLLEWGFPEGIHFFSIKGSTKPVKVITPTASIEACSRAFD
jgi:hypothetical protein